VHDIADEELGRSIAIGLAVGMPALFVVALILGLAAGLSLGQAALLALVPAFFDGWFYAGTVVFMRAADRNTETEPVLHIEERAETSAREAA
jgi:hypothetical protein